MRVIGVSVAAYLRAAADAVLPARAAGWLRVVAREAGDRRYPRRVVEHTYDGHRRRMVIASSYGEVYDAEWPAPPEFALLRDGRLRHGARVLNLGANHGVMALMLAGIVGPQGRVVALEADGRDARAAAQSAQINGLTHLTCLHAAVAERSGHVDFSTTGDVASSPRHGRRRVTAWSIDDLDARHGPFDVVYMDVEGYEALALRGAAGTLARPVDWFVEVHGDRAITQHGGTVHDVVRAFDSERWELMAGAGGFDILDDEVRHTTRFEPFDPRRGASSDRFFLVARHR